MNKGDKVIMTEKHAEYRTYRGLVFTVSGVFEDNRKTYVKLDDQYKGYACEAENLRTAGKDEIEGARWCKTHGFIKCSTCREYRKLKIEIGSQSMECGHACLVFAEKNVDLGDAEPYVVAYPASDEGCGCEYWSDKLGRTFKEVYEDWNKEDEDE